MDVGVSVLKDGGALTEILHEAEVLVFADRAFEIRAQTANQKLAAGRLRLRKIEASVGLHVAADAQVVAVVLRPNEKPLRPDLDHRPSQGLLVGGTWPHLELATDNLD